MQKHTDFTKISKKTLNELCIPERLKQLVPHPERIRVEYPYRSSNALLGLVVSGGTEQSERILKAISEMHQQDLARKNHLPYHPIPTYATLDRFYQHHIQLVKAYNEEHACLTEYDEWLLEIQLEKNEDTKELYLENYQDREVYRHQGVGTEFFKNIKAFAKKIGMRFITGSNEITRNHLYTERNPSEARFKMDREPNLAFFTDNCKGILLTQIKQEYWHLFTNKYDEQEYPEAFWIIFLYKEDQRKMLIK